MMKNQSYLKRFRTYQLAVAFYQAARGLKLPGHLRHQLLRASSSIVLNLAEGSAKPTPRDKRRFYAISMGSLRECQAILELSAFADSPASNLADRVGAHLYRLIEATPP